MFERLFLRAYFRFGGRGVVIERNVASREWLGLYQEGILRLKPAGIYMYKIPHGTHNDMDHKTGSTVAKWRSNVSEQTITI